jgi:hypothetical protein
MVLGSAGMAMAWVGMIQRCMWIMVLQTFWRILSTQCHEACWWSGEFLKLSSLALFVYKDGEGEGEVEVGMMVQSYVDGRRPLVYWSLILRDVHT